MEPGSPASQVGTLSKELSRQLILSVVCASHLTAMQGGVKSLTINVPVVFLALILNGFLGATSLLGALVGVGPKNLDFFDVTIAPLPPPPPTSIHPWMPTL